MRKVAVIVSVLLLVVLLWWAGPSTFSVLTSADPWFLLMALGAWVAINVVISYRIKWLAQFERNLSFKEVLKFHWAAMLLSDFTPSRLGYFLCPYLLSRYVSVAHALTVTFGVQVLEFVWKVVLSLLLLLLVFHAFEHFGVLLVFLSFSFVSLLSLFIIPHIPVVERVFSFPVLKKYAFVFHSFKNASAFLLRQSPIIFGFILITTVLKGLEWWFIAKALHITLFHSFIQELVFFSAFQAFIFFLNFLPLPTLAGTGFSEGVVVVFLMLLGVGKVEAVSFSIISRFVMLVVDTVVGSYALFNLHLKIDRIINVIEQWRAKIT